jgi:hypothetical protein
MSEKIKSALDALASLTGWMSGTIVTAALIAIFTEDKIKIFDVDIPRLDAGLLLFTISLFMVIQVTRQLLVLQDSLEKELPIYEEMTSKLDFTVDVSKKREILEDFRKAKDSWQPPAEEVELIQNHPWVLNPFAQSTRRIRYIADSLPYAALVGVWGIGIALGLALVNSNNKWFVSNLPDSSTILLKLQQTNDPVSVYVFNRLSKNTRQALAEWPGLGSVSDQLREGLLQDLNAIIHGQSIYEKDRFANVHLREVTTNFLPQNLRDQKEQSFLAKSNWLLLEDWRPDFFKQKQDDIPQWIIVSAFVSYFFASVYAMTLIKTIMSHCLDYKLRRFKIGIGYFFFIGIPLTIHLVHG